MYNISMWFIFASLSALIYSLRSILEKWSLQKVDPYILALSVRLFALPLFILPFIFGIAHFPAISELPLRFWGAIFLISFVMTPMEMIFFYKALKTEEVSYVAPLLGLSPLMTTFFGAIFFREFPTIIGVFGMVIIVFALYILNLEKKNEHFLDPFKYLVSNQAFKYIILMLLSYSLGILIDKLAIKSSDIYFYSLLNYFFVSISLLLIALVKAKKSLNQIRVNIVPFSLIGLVVAAYTWLRFAALEQGKAGYVSAVLSSSVFFTILIGAILFKEKDLSKKIFVGIMILIGMAIVKIFG